MKHCQLPLLVERDFFRYRMDGILVVRIHILINHVKGHFRSPDALRKLELEGLILHLIRLEACVTEISDLPLSSIFHFRVTAVRCLRMVMLFDLPDLFTVCCLCGHYQDHSIVGRSAIGNPVTGVGLHLRVHHDLRNIRAGLPEPLIRVSLNIDVNGFGKEF